jgi:8-oxo-dGTP diphosphatase
MRPAYVRRGTAISAQPTTIVVDVANVMGSRPDGWWRDRPGAAARLYAEITRLAATGRAIPPAPKTSAIPQAPPAPETSAIPEAPPAPPAPEAPPGFVLVLEGAANKAVSRLEPDDRVRLVQAAGSGDDAIVALVRELPGRRVVVTADRELRQRCEAAGATVLGPGWLLALLSA